MAASPAPGRHITPQRSRQASPFLADTPTPFTSEFGVTSSRSRLSTSFVNPRHRMAPATTSTSPDASPWSLSARLATPPAQTRNRVPSAPFNTPLSASLPRSQPAAPPPALISAAVAPMLADAAKASSTVPTSAHQELVKSLLKTRLIRVYALSYAVLHLLLSYTFARPTTPLLSAIAPLLPTCFALSALAFLFGVLPLLVFRKRTLSSRRPVAPRLSVQLLGFELDPASPLAHAVTVILRRPSQLLIGMHVASGAILALVYVLGRALYAGRDHYSEWAPYRHVKLTVSRSGGGGADGSSAGGAPMASAYELALRPNEKFFFLIAANAAVGALHALAQCMRSDWADVVTPDGSGAPFDPASTAQPLSSRVSAALGAQVGPSAVLGLSLPTLLVTTYAAVRRPLFRSVLSLLGSRSSLRPLLVPSFRYRFATPSLFYHATAVGAVSCVAWGASSALWTVYSTQPVGNLCLSAREPVRCLIEGLRGRRSAGAATDLRYYATFAFAELSMVAASDAKRRGEIFRELRAPVPASASLASSSAAATTRMTTGGGGGGELRSGWAAVATECLAALDDEKRALLDRRTAARDGAGGAAAGSDPKTSPTSTNRPGAPASPSAAKHDAVVHGEPASATVKPPAASFWDRLASAFGATTKPKPGDAKASTSPPSAAAPGAASAATTSSSTAVQPSSAMGLDVIMRRLVPEASIHASHQGNGADPVAAAPRAAPPPSTPRPTPAPVALATVATALRWTAGYAHAAWRLLPADVRVVVSSNAGVRGARAWLTWLLRPSASVAVGRQHPREPAVSAWAAQALTSLVAASRDEDAYGTLALASTSSASSSAASSFAAAATTPAGCGVEAVAAVMAELLTELVTFGQEMEAMARHRDEELDAIYRRRSITEAKPRSPSASAPASTAAAAAAVANTSADGADVDATDPSRAEGADVGDGGDVPATHDGCTRALAEAWETRAAPLVLALRAGLVQLLATLEPDAARGARGELGIGGAPRFGRPGSSTLSSSSSAWSPSPGRSAAGGPGGVAAGVGRFDGGGGSASLRRDGTDARSASAWSSATRAKVEAALGMV